MSRRASSPRPRRRPAPRPRRCDHRGHRQLTAGQRLADAQMSGVTPQSVPSQASVRRPGRDLVEVTMPRGAGQLRSAVSTRWYVHPASPCSAAPTMTAAIAVACARRAVFRPSSRPTVRRGSALVGEKCSINSPPYRVHPPWGSVTLIVENGRSVPPLTVNILVRVSRRRRVPARPSSIATSPRRPRVARKTCPTVRARTSRRPIFDAALGSGLRTSLAPRGELFAAAASSSGRRTRIATTGDLASTTSISLLRVHATDPPTRTRTVDPDGAVIEDTVARCAPVEGEQAAGPGHAALTQDLRRPTHRPSPWRHLDRHPAAALLAEALRFHAHTS